MPTDPLVIKHLVVYPDQIPGITKDILFHLLDIDPESWSATTLTWNGCSLVIHNPTHSARCQESDLVHELAHLIYKHEPSRLVHIDPSFPVLRSYDPEQEEEAAWLGDVCSFLAPLFYGQYAREWIVQPLKPNFWQAV